VAARVARGWAPTGLGDPNPRPARRKKEWGRNTSQLKMNHGTMDLGEDFRATGWTEDGTANAAYGSGARARQRPAKTQNRNFVISEGLMEEHQREERSNVPKGFRGHSTDVHARKPGSRRPDLPSTFHSNVPMKGWQAADDPYLTATGTQFAKPQKGQYAERRMVVNNGSHLKGACVFPPRRAF